MVLVPINLFGREMFYMTLYWYCLSIGLITLLLSLLLDGISDLFQGLTFFDIHFDILPGILPLSPLQLCAFLVGFGGIGITTMPHTKFHLFLSLMFGFLLSYSTKLLLSKLRQVDSTTLTPTDLIGLEGIVIVTIFEGGTGSVSLNTKVGKITYSAQSNHFIKQGTPVKVIDIKHTLLIVSDDPHYFLNSSSFS